MSCCRGTGSRAACSTRSTAQATSAAPASPCARSGGEAARRRTARAGLVRAPLAAHADVERLLRAFRVRHRDLVAAEVPRHGVDLDPFYVDVTPVTNAQFSAFLRDRPEWRPGRLPRRYHNGQYLRHWQGDDYPPGLGEHPAVFVSWYAAVAYAAWAGKRLPTEAEWEYAARGGLEGAAFPWGDEPVDPRRASYAGSGIGTTTAVGTYPPNGYGLCDMAGNVWEYCLDEWQAEFYATSPAANPVAGDAWWRRRWGEQSHGLRRRRGSQHALAAGRQCCDSGMLIFGMSKQMPHGGTACW